MKHKLTKLSTDFKDAETIVEIMYNIYANVIEREICDMKNISWLSIGYDQHFRVGVGYEKPPSHELQSLINLMDNRGSDNWKEKMLSKLKKDKGNEEYEVLSKLENICVQPLLTVLLSAMVCSLEKRVKESLKNSLQNDFQVFIWTNNECYEFDNSLVPDFSELFYELEDDDCGDGKVEMIHWLKSFCSTGKLYKYLVGLINDPEQQLTKQAKKYWNLEAM